MTYAADLLHLDPVILAALCMLPAYIAIGGAVAWKIWRTV